MESRLVWTHQTERRKKEKRKGKSQRRAGNLDIKLRALFQKKRVFDGERVKENERWWEGKKSGCVRLPLSPPSIIEV